MATYEDITLLSSKRDKDMKELLKTLNKQVKGNWTELTISKLPAKIQWELAETHRQLHKYGYFDDRRMTDKQLFYYWTSHLDEMNQLIGEWKMLLKVIKALRKGNWQTSEATQSMIDRSNEKFEDCMPSEFIQAMGWD